jgi:hypothetical protein
MSFIDHDSCLNTKQESTKSIINYQIEDLGFDTSKKSRRKLKNSILEQVKDAHQFLKKIK